MSGLQAGAEVPFIEMSKISQEQIAAYAEASGDHNTIHLNPEAARAVGLPGTIAHGMLVAALVGERAMRFVDELPGVWRTEEFRARFKAMTFPGDQISVGGTIKEATTDRFTMALNARNQKGEVVTMAWVIVTRAH